MRLPFAVAVCASACVGVSSAQTRAAAVTQPAPTGTVSGQITAAGSNGPVRFAKVALQPVEVKPETRDSKGPVMVYQVYQTDLNGSFVIPHVAPGRYYLVVTATGFLSPFDSFTHAELEHPSAEVQQRIDSSLTTVTVRPNSATVQDTQLTHGAQISGVVRFDDGTAYPDARVFLERRDADGKWVTPINDGFGYTGVDGQYTFSGLTPGEYRFGVNLVIEELKQSSLIGERGMMANRWGYGMELYFGDTTHKADAKTRTLTDGEAARGMDITVPASKMHTLSGAVVDARTGHAINAGKVSLMDGDHEITTANIEDESSQFGFAFVPEGKYTLAIKDARLVRHEAAPEEPGFGFGSPGKEVVLQKYGAGELPIVVTGDMQAVNVPVELAPSKPR